jgi:hypothetical protein
MNLKSLNHLILVIRLIEPPLAGGQWTGRHIHGTIDNIRKGSPRKAAEREIGDISKSIQAVPCAAGRWPGINRSWFLDEFFKSG